MGTFWPHSCGLEACGLPCAHLRPLRSIPCLGHTNTAQKPTPPPCSGLVWLVHHLDVKSSGVPLGGLYNCPWMSNCPFSVIRILTSNSSCHRPENDMRHDHHRPLGESICPLVGCTARRTCRHHSIAHGLCAAYPERSILSTTQAANNANGRPSSGEPTGHYQHERLVGLVGLATWAEEIPTCK